VLTNLKLGIGIHFDSFLQAAGPGVSADKPRIHSTETTLDFHAPADFRFFFDDTGATMRLSDLEDIQQSVANMIQGAQARVLGSCGDGAAINEVPPPHTHTHTPLSRSYPYVRGCRYVLTGACPGWVQGDRLRVVVWPRPLTLPLDFSPMTLLAQTQIQENGNVVCTNTISASVMGQLNEDMTQMRTSIRESEFNLGRRQLYLVVWSSWIPHGCDDDNDGLSSLLLRRPPTNLPVQPALAHSRRGARGRTVPVPAKPRSSAPGPLHGPTLAQA